MVTVLMNGFRKYGGRVKNLRIVENMSKCKKWYFRMEESDGRCISKSIGKD
jgi:hypothetical protein